MILLTIQAILDGDARMIVILFKVRQHVDEIVKSLDHVDSTLLKHVEVMTKLEERL